MPPDLLRRQYTTVLGMSTRVYPEEKVLESEAAYRICRVLSEKVTYPDNIMSEANTSDTTTRSILRTLKDMGFVNKAPPFGGRRTEYEMFERKMYEYWLNDLMRTVEEAKEQIDLSQEEKNKLVEEVRQMPENLETYYETGPECLHDIEDVRNINSKIEDKIHFWTLQVASESFHIQTGFKDFFLTYIGEYFNQNEQSTLEDMFYKDLMAEVGGLDDSLVSQVLAIALYEKYPGSDLFRGKSAFLNAVKRD